MQAYTQLTIVTKYYSLGFFRPEIPHKLHCLSCSFAKKKTFLSTFQIVQTGKSVCMLVYCVCLYKIVQRDILSVISRHTPCVYHRGLSYKLTVNHCPQANEKNISLRQMCTYSAKTNSRITA